MSLSKPGWAETYFGIAEVIAQRATCPRLQTAAVVVSTDQRILATGYNGAPNKAAECHALGCIMEDGHCIRSVHAELNALLYAARRGIALDGSTMYCLHAPCVRCAICIAQAGIQEVLIRNWYGSDAGSLRLHELDISVKWIA